MRRLVVNLDDNLDLWLAKYPNQNDIVRKALELYKGDITTDTVQGMRTAFIQLTKKMQDLEERFIEQYEMVEKTHDTIVELANR